MESAITAWVRRSLAAWQPSGLDFEVAQVKLGRSYVVLTLKACNRC